ncbi:F-box/LRR-repeat protein At3g03360-like [Alnus glutinosa]|uniref:F-box/LRR-repeat protein At3g03360-like n=1 Tax=Alnus glutinosa TaxID=3517 RepID=UPI002D77D371|nr:F-box/LRR-repeat protein At3g03360-like [Alnus glutinosa]
MEHKIDRISELPEPVLEHILSFIPLKKKNLQLSTFPIPEFDHIFSEFNPFRVEKLGNISNNEKKQTIRRKKDDFRYFVERVLQSRYRRRLSINKFKLMMILDHESDCALVDSWIGYAIERNVKEIYLEIVSLFESVLTAKSITELNLVAIKLDSFYSEVNLSSLRKLSLYAVRVEDHQFIQTLLTGCPVVEEISLEVCLGLKSIRVSGLPKLMALKLTDKHDLERVEVQASTTLQSLHIHNHKPCMQMNLAPCENLKKLVLCAPTTTDKWLHEVLLKHPLIE